MPFNASYQNYKISNRGFSPSKSTIEAVNELRKLLSKSKGPLQKKKKL